jgi:hypothetical protein
LARIVGTRAVYGVRRQRPTRLGESSSRQPRWRS